MTRYLARYGVIALFAIAGFALLPSPAAAQCVGPAGAGLVNCPPGVPNGAQFVGFNQAGNKVFSHFTAPPQGFIVPGTFVFTPFIGPLPAPGVQPPVSPFGQFNLNNSQSQASTTLNPGGPLNSGTPRGADGSPRRDTVFDDPIIAGIAAGLRRLEDAWRKATDPEEKNKLQAEIDAAREGLRIATFQDILDGLRQWNMSPEERFVEMIANAAANIAADAQKELKRLENAWRTATDPEEKNKAQAEIDKVRDRLGIGTLQDVLNALGRLDSLNARTPALR